MIIDPITNDLGPRPPHSGEHSSMVPTVDVDYDSVSYKLPEDPPPPYTEIDGLESFTAVLNPGPSIPQTLSRAHFRHSPLHRGVLSSGEQVLEGLRQMANSAMFAAEAALFSIGGLAQGFGKIMNGLGMAIAERRALSWKSF